MRHATDPSLPAEGYRITVDHHGSVSVDSSDSAGRFYAELTLDQLRRCSPDETIPVGVIEDWPDLAVRGVMLDVSRSKVPTLETLFSLVERLSSWKLNQLQVYIEHTFAYPGHEEVWQEADPYDAGELALLSQFCADRHMTLVANQNTLGHMERWLLHDRYSPLGVIRGVGSGPMGMPMAASTLDPANPAALSLARHLLGTLGDAIKGSRIHVGLDEPWDLPPERAGEWGEWLGALRSAPETEGRELLVWGDMPAAHPELLPALEGITVCEWGYEAGHPFAERLGELRAAGIRRWASPGTSSWMSVLGRTTNAVDNCREAALASMATGAEGILVTDWGDFGHHQHLPVSDPGLAAAAAFSWCVETNSQLEPAHIGRLLDRHCYQDQTGTMGAAVVALGDVHRLHPLQLPNISALVLPLYFPQLPVGSALGAELSEADLAGVDEVVDDALAMLANSRPATEHGRLAVEELTASGRLIQHLSADARARLGGDGTFASMAPGDRTELAEGLASHIETHRRRWLARNRPGGLDESCSWLEHLAQCYRSGTADDDWAGPMVAAARARQPK